MATWSIRITWGWFLRRKTARKQKVKTQEEKEDENKGGEAADWLQTAGGAEVGPEDCYLRAKGWAGRNICGEEPCFSLLPC